MAKTKKKMKGGSNVKYKGSKVDYGVPKVDYGVPKVDYGSSVKARSASFSVQPSPKNYSSQPKPRRVSYGNTPINPRINTKEKIGENEFKKRRLSFEPDQKLYVSQSFKTPSQRRRSSTNFISKARLFGDIKPSLLIPPAAPKPPPVPESKKVEPQAKNFLNNIKVFQESTLKKTSPASIKPNIASTALSVESPLAAAIVATKDPTKFARLIEERKLKAATATATATATAPETEATVIRQNVTPRELQFVNNSKLKFVPGKSTNIGFNPLKFTNEILRSNEPLNSERHQKELLGLNIAGRYKNSETNNGAITTLQRNADYAAKILEARRENIRKKAAKQNTPESTKKSFFSRVGNFFGRKDTKKNTPENLAKQEKNKAEALRQKRAAFLGNDPNLINTPANLNEFRKNSNENNSKTFNFRSYIPSKEKSKKTPLFSGFRNLFGRKKGSANIGTGESSEPEKLPTQLSNERKLEIVPGKTTISNKNPYSNPNFKPYVFNPKKLSNKNKNNYNSVLEQIKSNLTKSNRSYSNDPEKLNAHAEYAARQYMNTKALERGREKEPRQSFFSGLFGKKNTKKTITAANINKSPTIQPFGLPKNSTNMNKYMREQYMKESPKQQRLATEAEAKAQTNPAVTPAPVPAPAPATVTAPTTAPTPVIEEKAKEKANQNKANNNALNKVKSNLSTGNITKKLSKLFSSEGEIKFNSQEYLKSPNPKEYLTTLYGEKSGVIYKYLEDKINRETQGKKGKSLAKAKAEILENFFKNLKPQAPEVKQNTKLVSELAPATALAASPVISETTQISNPSPPPIPSFTNKRTPLNTSTSIPSPPKINTTPVSTESDKFFSNITSRLSKAKPEERPKIVAEINSKKKEFQNQILELEKKLKESKNDNEIENELKPQIELLKSNLKIFNKNYR